MTRSLTWLACVAIALTTAACGREEVEDTAEVVRPVKTIVVGGMVSGELRFPARVEADEKAVLSFRVSGRLIELPIEEGQEVEQEQLIARLDPRDFEIALEEAVAQYTKAEADFTRYRSLYEKDAVPISDLESYRSRRDVAKARVEQAKKNLSYTWLRAPFAGAIGRRYVENFMDVQAQQEIVDLNDLRRVELQIDVAEIVVRQVEAGMTVDVFALFENRPGKRYPLELKEFASRADPTTQTFRVRFVMPQPDDFNLLPGMTAEVLVVFAGGERMAPENRDLLVPAIAVMGDPESEGFVWVVDGDMTVHKKAVTLGPISGSENVRILSGLQGGERVVVAGLTKLQEGMKVRLWERSS